MEEEQLERVVDESFNASLEAFPVYCETKRDSIKMAFMHAHDGYEFHFSFSSVGVLKVEGAEYAFAPGVLTVIRPRAFHMIQSTQESEYWRLILSIEEAYLTQLAQPAPVIGELLDGWFANPRVVSVQVGLPRREESEAIQRLLSSIEGELRQRQPHFETVVQARIMELFALLGRCSDRGAAAEAVPERYRAAMDRAADYIAEHCSEPLSADELAARFHMSKSYLHRLFKRHTGLSPNQYQMLQRINLAKKLLSETEEPITDIALTVGFGEMAHFSRYFKETTGESPSAYRARTRRLPT